MGDLLGKRFVGLRPLRRVFGEHSGDEALERVRHLGPYLREPRRVLEERLRQDGGQITARERRVPREAFEENTPEREDVGARVEELVPAGLLGRHIADGADRKAHRRELVVHLNARDAEVDELRLVRFASDQEQVARLDVAMDRPAGVRERERRGGRSGDGERLGDGERALDETLGEALALEPFHREELHAVVRRPVGDVPDDRRVLELREDARLALESWDRVLVGEAVQQL